MNKAAETRKHNKELREKRAAERERLEYLIRDTCMRVMADPAMHLTDKLRAAKILSQWL